MYVDSTRIAPADVRTTVVNRACASSRGQRGAGGASTDTVVICFMGGHYRHIKSIHQSTRGSAMRISRSLPTGLVALAVTFFALGFSAAGATASSASFIGSCGGPAPDVCYYYAGNCTGGCAHYNCEGASCPGTIGTSCWRCLP